MSFESTNPERMPPQSRDAEKSVIGSVLRDNQVLSDLLQIIRPDNFYFDAHQKIFTAILELYNDGKPVDPVILFECLKAKKQIEDIGGASYIGELWDAAPTAANAEYYARIVREKALIRNLIHTSTELLRDAYDGVTSADELIGMAERKVLEIAEKGTTGETFTLETTLRDTFTRIDERAGKSHLNVTGLGTGSLTRWSSMGPQAVSAVPQMSMMSCEMRSMCSTVWLGSTPRSKRCPASVEKLKRRERPAMALGHQNAASTYTCSVSSDTAVASPPMMPARDST